MADHTDPEIHVVRKLAAKYRTGFVPLDGIMNQAGIACGFEKIADDGVHPTEMGHRIIADAWMTEYEKEKRKDKSETGALRGRNDYAEREIRRRV